MRSISAFNPDEEDKKVEQKILETKEYQFKCWLPESIVTVGDVWIYYNDVDGSEFDDCKWIAEAIKKNPQWIHVLYHTEDETEKVIGVEKKEKIKALEAAIADAERRTGQFIMQGGEADSDYVEKQKQFVIDRYKDINEIMGIK